MCIDEQFTNLFFALLPELESLVLHVDMAAGGSRNPTILREKQYDVCNVVGSSWDNRGSMKKYWEFHMKVKFPKKCQIEVCENDATGGGHMWVRDHSKFFILPICQSCNKNPEYDDKIDKSNYTKTKERACLVSRDNMGTKRLGMMMVDDFLCGEFDVSYDPHPGPWKVKWCNATNCNQFSNVKCQLLECEENATMVCCMLVYRLSKFSFILPICDECKKLDNFKTTYYPTKEDAKLVAVKRQLSS